MQTTRLSTKGQIVLSKGIRTAHSWGAAEFIVEETTDGILLRPAGFTLTDLDQVAGCLQSKRKPKTFARMRAELTDEIVRRHGRGRY